MTLTLKPVAAAMLAVLAVSAHADEKRHFDIPAQPLSTALQTFARQTGTPLLYADSSAAGKRSPGLRGDYSTSEAVEKLVSGSGLVLSVAADGAVTLKPSGFIKTATDGESETTLPKVTVEADAEYDPEYYADPYNKDYVIPNATAGTKTDTPIMETPLNVQVISKQVLKDQQVINLNDSLKNVSGVTAVGNTANLAFDGSSPQALVLRGFESQTFFATDLGCNRVRQAGEWLTSNRLRY